MELKYQVCSLPLARRLREMGVMNERPFEWRRYESLGLWSEWELSLDNDGVVADDTAPAFTVSELGALLPDELWDEEDGGWDNLCSYPNGSHWCCAYRRYYGDDGTWSTTFVEKAKTEADARAKMLVYLIENGLVKP